MAASAPVEKPPTDRHLIRRILTVGIVLAFVALLVYGLISKAPNDSIDQSLAGLHPARAPGFELPVLASGELGRSLSAKLASAKADGRVSLAELRGTPIVLNFWASWCVPCREEAPILERGWQRYRAEGVLFVGLDMQDLTTDAQAFITKYHNTYLNVRDQGSDTAHDWGVTGVPETFFISPRSTVVGHVIGVVSPAQLSEGIAASRSGRAVGTLTGGASRPTR